MLVGRNKELEQLNNIYSKPSSSILLLYGRTGIGKTSLIREFIQDKDAFFYSCFPSAKDEARFFLANAVFGESELNPYLSRYEDVFVGIPRDKDHKKIIVIDEFTNISRGDSDFIDGVLTMVKNPADFGRVMVVLISSSISYVEGNSAKIFEKNSAYVDEMKLGPLSFADSMPFFSNYKNMEDFVRFYGLTGGVPKYIKRLNRSISFEENIVRMILPKESRLVDEGHAFVLEELRESASYNTILGCLARGMLKINDIYNYTGFGRDKISVYLKNVIERDIVEKKYSYDISGKETIKKGCYRVTPGLLNFWYKFIYPHPTEMITMEPQEYFDRFIRDYLDEFCEEAFIHVCTEYMRLMEEHGQLSIVPASYGRIYEKDNRIDVVVENEEGKHIVAYCDFSAEPMKKDILVHMEKACKEEKLDVVDMYLFSRNGFDEELTSLAEQKSHLHLVDGAL